MDIELYEVNILEFLVFCFVMLHFRVCPTQCKSLTHVVTNKANKQEGQIKFIYKCIYEQLTFYL